MSDNEYRHDGGLMLAAEAAFEWARSAMREGEWELAAARWNTLRSAYPHESSVWVEGGVCLVRAGYKKEGLELLAEAREYYPEDSQAWCESVQVSMDIHALDDASRLAEHCRLHFPEKLETWITSAELAFRKGDVEQAKTFNRESRERFPDQLAPFVQTAEFFMSLEQWEEALAGWAEVRRKFPDVEEGYLRAANAYEQLGEPRYARRLRLAREYGQEWLEELDEDEEDSQSAITPPPHRSLGAFLDLVWTKAKFNMKSEAKQHQLHYLWWLIDPILYMSVFYVVFGYVMQRGGEGFVGYLLTGIVPFHWFGKTVQHTASSIMEGQGLMHQVRISPVFFPLVGVVQNTGKQIPVFAMLLMFLLIYGKSPSIEWLAVFPVAIVNLLFIAVCSCAIAVTIPLFKDLINLVPTAIQFLLFASGIFYTTNRIPEQWEVYFFMNPVANLLKQYRTVLLDNQWPDWVALGWLVAGCVVCGYLVMLVYRRFAVSFPRLVIE